MSSLGLLLLALSGATVVVIVLMLIVFAALLRAIEFSQVKELLDGSRL